MCLSVLAPPVIGYRPYSYWVMDDVIVSIAISITELAIRTTEWQKSGTLYYKSSEALKFGVWKQHMFTYQVCCLRYWSFHCKLALVGDKKARENKPLYCLLWVFLPLSVGGCTRL